MRTRTAGALARRRLDQLAIHRVRIGQHAQRLDETGDREAAKVADETAAGGAKVVAAEAEDVNRGILRAESFDERAGVQIAGRLAARQHHSHESARFQEDIRGNFRIDLHTRQLPLEEHLPAARDRRLERDADAVPPTDSREDFLRRPRL